MKWSTLSIVFVWVLFLIAILVVAGIYMDDMKTEDCTISNEFADTYLIDCQSVGINGTAYTICRQKNLEFWEP